MRGHWAATAAIWVLAAVGAVAVLLAVEPDSRPGMFALVLAGAVVLTFCVQLATADRRGFVLRLMAGTLGALGILVLASVVALVVP
ncbi:hypothetical protein [Naasia sp. SYSU D00057]|uniref:hypothetical protein n=1 Tax=Naasia sp. SYSU D00057 TaxID=2817380 RepID=UPI001B30B228|nr:hypothetical protein [Naasia sp. SYSU D00057]